MTPSAFAAEWAGSQRAERAGFVGFDDGSERERLLDGRPAASMVKGPSPQRRTHGPLPQGEPGRSILEEPRQRVQ